MWSKNSPAKNQRLEPVLRPLEGGLGKSESLGGGWGKKGKGESVPSRNPSSTWGMRKVMHHNNKGGKVTPKGRERRNTSPKSFIPPTRKIFAQGAKKTRKLGGRSREKGGS